MGERRKTLIRKDTTQDFGYFSVFVYRFSTWGSVIFAHATAVRVSACVKKLADSIQCLLVGSLTVLINLYLSSHFGPRLSPRVVT